MRVTLNRRRTLNQRKKQMHVLNESQTSGLPSQHNDSDKEFDNLSFGSLIFTRF